MFSERRCRMVEHLASALWHMTQEGSPIARETIVLLEHRIRDVLRDGECPSCAEIQLAKELDAATEGK